MKLLLDCYPCTLKQALQTANLLRLEDEQTQNVLDYCMQLLLARTGETTPLHITTDLYSYIHKTFFPEREVFDPYREIKHETNRIALSCYPQLEQLMAESTTPLETALKIAAAGNIIDFGVADHRHFDIAQEIRSINNLKFSLYDYSQLKEMLSTARTLLYIGDNTGEIVFDRILIRYLKTVYPALAVTFAVREKPIINDATLDDAYAAGLHNDATLISSGCIFPGTFMKETSDHFQSLFHSADIIIAKGQGNFEGLSDEQNEHLFFILRIKCEQVAKKIGAENGSLILWQKHSH